MEGHVTGTTFALNYYGDGDVPQLTHALRLRLNP